MKNYIKKATILSFFIFAASLSWAVPSDLLSQSLEASLTKMEALYSRGRWDEAIKTGQGILKDAPQGHPAQMRAKDLVLLSVQGRNNEILNNKKRAEAKKIEEHGEALYLNAVSSMKKGGYSEAAQMLEQAHRLKKGNAASYYQQGYSYLQSGNKKAAFEAFKTALTKDPKHDRALYYVAALSYELEKNQITEKYCKDFLTEAEKLSEILKKDFASQREKRENAKATETAKRLKLLNKNVGRANVMLGLLLSKRKAYGEAIEPLTLAIKAESENADLWFALGVASYHGNMLNQASNSIKQTIGLKERMLRANSGEALRLLESNKSDKAVEAELAQRKLKKDLALAYYTMSLINTKKGIVRGNMDILDKALEYDPDFTQAEYNKAVVMASEGKLEEAVELMKKLLAKSEPDSPKTAKIVQGITLLMNRMTKRDNPQAYAKMREPSEVEKVRIPFNDIEALGGKRQEERLLGVFDEIREVSKLIKLQNYDEAIRRLVYLRSKHPDVADVSAILGHCYTEQGRYKEAEASFRKAISLQPSHYEALNGLAYVLSTQDKELQYALSAVNKAIAGEPAKSEFYHTQGSILFKLGEVEKSAQAFQKAIEINPKHKLARYDLGLSLYIMKNYRGAIDNFDALLADNPVHEKALIFKSMALAKINRVPEALDSLTILNRHLPDNSKLKKMATEMHDKMASAYERKTEVPVPEIKSPAPVERLVQEGNEFRAKGLVNRAKEKYLECIRLAPDRYEPYYELGLMYAASGLNTSALSSWQSAERLKPDYYPIVINIGKMYQKLDKAANAEEYFRRAMALSPKMAEPPYYLGLISYGAGNFESAESYALDALKLDKKYYKAMALLGMARIKQDRLEPAKDIYETLYVSAPANSRMKQHARSKIWQIAKLQAAKETQTAAMKHKEEVVKRINESEKNVVAKTPREATLIDAYGPSMSKDDKRMVLSTLSQFKRVPKMTGVNSGTFNENMAKTSLSAADKQWINDKAAKFGGGVGKYDLPEEERYGIKATKKKYVRKPDPADTIILSGISLASKGRSADALAEFAKARKASPDNLDLLLNIGFVNTLQGNFKDAFDAYARAHTAHPESDMAKLALGNLYWLGGQGEAAVKLWKAIEGEFIVDADYNVLSKSAEIWKKIVDLDPEDADAHSNLGVIYLFSGEPAKAVIEFNAVKSLTSGRSTEEFYKAQAAVQLYMQTKQKIHLNEAKEILSSMSTGARPFPHSERLKQFVAML